MAEQDYCPSYEDLEEVCVSNAADLRIPRCGFCGMLARVRGDGDLFYVDCSWDMCAAAGPLRQTRDEAVRAWTERFAPEWSGAADRCGYCNCSAELALDADGGYSVECSNDDCAAAGPVRSTEGAAQNAWARLFLAPIIV